MAIVEMKKLSLVGLKSEREKILKALHYTNCVELTVSEDLKGVEREIDEKKQEQLLAFYDKIESTVIFIEDKIQERATLAKKDKQDDYKKPSKPLFFYRREVSFDEFMLIANDEIELKAVIYEIDLLKAKIADNKAEKLRLQNQIEQLKIYSGADVNFSLVRPTKNMRLYFGIIPNANISKLENTELPLYITRLAQTSTVDVVFAMCHKECSEAVQSHLSDCGFSACPYSFDGKAIDKIAEYSKKIDELLISDKESVVMASEYGGKLDSLKLLCDYYKIQLEKCEAEKGFLNTSATFIMQGYVPIGHEDAVKTAVGCETENCLMFFDRPKDDEEVPTMTQNSKLVAPYESVTNLYSAPRATEKDPNLFVGMFFFIFFGLMISDAGYGIVMTVLTLVLMRLFKMESGMKKMVLILCMGGVSTIIWGALFGTWFGADVANVPILKNIMWFNPLDDPMMMLYLCLFLGVVQILFGMGIKGVALIRDKQIFSAIFDIGSWYVFFIGIGVLILSMLFSFSIYIGFIIIGVSLLMIVATAGRHKKGVFGKVLGGLGGLYNIINLLSDILSYARLFGLGVATGVIGMTMNLMANMMFGAWYTIPFGILILIGGHAFNLAINLLGAYIHNCRLQFIEFFGKFYEGGGYEFAPLGTSTKYVKIK